MLLAAQRRGVRLLEAMTLLLIARHRRQLRRRDRAGPAGLGSACCAASCPGLDNSSPKALSDSLYIAIGMLGATVMPHNLYLHSALVQTRAFPQTDAGKRQALQVQPHRFARGPQRGLLRQRRPSCSSPRRDFEEPVESLTQAHDLLKGVWGAAVASILFAVALLASGQSST